MLTRLTTKQPKTIKIHAYRKRDKSDGFDMVLELEVPVGTTIAAAVHEVATACQTTVTKMVVRDLDFPVHDPRGGFSALQWMPDDTDTQLHHHRRVWLQPEVRGG